MLVMMQLIGLMWYSSAADEPSTDNIKPLASHPDNSFQLIPKVEEQTVKQTYTDLTKADTRHQFWDKYNEKATKLSVDQQLATWVMNWDTIIAYSAVVITFISNLWLVVGAWFIIWSGYQYAMSAFGMKEDNGKAIKNALIGIAVIATSYGIFRLLTRIFIE
jgi:hypothetical protein